MTTELAAILCVTAFKLATLAVGLASLAMGYSLFARGIWGRSGEQNELVAAFGNNRLMMKSAAPGAFFALFGAVFISISVFRGFTVTPVGSGDTRPPAAGESVDAGGRVSRDRPAEGRGASDEAVAEGGRKGGVTGGRVEIKGTGDD